MRRKLPFGAAAVFTLFVIFGCNTQQPGPQTTGTGPDTLIATPTNSQTVSAPFEVVGHTFDVNLVTAVTVYLMPVYGGDTNALEAVVGGGMLSTFRAEVTNLANGYYYIWVKSLNTLNQATITRRLLVNVASSSDTTAPVVTIGAPTEGQQVGKTYTFSGTVSDDSSGVDFVYVKVDSDSFKPVTVVNGNWSTNFTVEMQGTHINSVYAVDKAGNVSGTKQVTVDYVAGMPSIVVTSPSSGLITNGISAKVSGTASVSSPYTISKVQVRIGSASWQDATISGYIMEEVVGWSIATLSLEEGTNQVYARAISDNGKTNTTPALLIVRDAINPSVTITAPIEGYSSTNSSVTISGNASDSGSGIEGVYLAIDDNGFNKISTAATWTFSVNLPNGNHVIKVYVMDKAKNVSVTNTRNITIGSDDEDTLPPTLTIVSPTSNQTFTQATLAVSGTASDPSGVMGVYVAVDSGSFSRVTGTLSWNTNLTLTVGAHTIKFYAKDNKGNTTTVRAIPVTRTSTGNIITIHYENGNDWSTVKMHWGFGYYQNVTDVNPAGYDGFGPFFEVDWNSAESSLSCCFNNGSGSWDGTDRAVNKPGSFPSEVWIKTSSATVYTSNPNDTTPPTVELTAPFNGATLSNTVTVSANASDNVGVTKVEFYRGTVKISEDTSSPYSITWNTAYAPDGSHVLFARAYDAAGNSADSASIIVYTQNTNVPPIADAGEDITIRVSNIAHFDASGSYDPNGTIASYTWDNGLTGVNPTKTYNTPGVYNVTLTVRDNEGAIDTDVVKVTVTTNSVVSTVFSWDNATVYFVITDRFYNGNTANDNSYGRQLDGQQEIGTFHGGDLAGLTVKLNEGYFTNLGINAIWITAPYEQIHGWVAGGSGDFKHYPYHGYYVLDYTKIDASMGTTNELKAFIDKAHSQGIRVIFDIVMNHTGYNTLWDMNAYNFGELYSGWESATPQNYHSYINYSSPNWVNWWGPDWIRSGMPGYTPGGGDDLTMCLSYLPDFKTESTTYVGLPTFFAQKTDTRAVYLPNTTVRGYLITWLSEWVRVYGVDGFRCDTAKHVEQAAWAALKASCNNALATWKSANPSKKLDDLPFWMTGEVWGHGVDNDSYYDNGFDSLINFTFQGAIQNGISSYSGIEGTYSYYASAINNDSTFNVLSYISSHDTSIFFNGDVERQKKAGTLLLLCPGGVQVFYGDENCRAFGATGSDPNQGTRSQMQWPGNTTVLAHWQKIGRFRNRHTAVGAGSHSQIASSPYTFSRIYDKNGISDKVVCVLGASGSTTVNVSTVFANGAVLRDYYSGTTATVSSGSVTFTPVGDVLLIEQAQ